MTGPTLHHRPPKRRCLRVGLSAMALTMWACFNLAQATPQSQASYDDAVRRYAADDARGAIVQLKNVLAADPKMLAAHVLMGRSLYKAGELKAAEAAFEDALKLGVARDEVMLDLGRLRLAFGEPRRALEMVPEQVTNAAIRPEALVIRGSAFALLGDLVSATRLADMAQRAAPNLASPLLLQSQIKQRQGDVAGARAAVQRAVELAPKDAAAWVVLARMQQQARDTKGSAASLDRALSLAPRHADARVARVGARIAAGQDALAAEDLEVLKTAGIRDPRASYFRGVLAARRGDGTGAQAAFQDAVALVTAIPMAVAATDDQLLMAGALSAKAAGNTAQAREFVTTILNFNARNAPAQLLMAEMLVEAKDYRKARPMLTALRQAMPDNPKVLSLLGVTEMALRNQGQANELLEQAFKLDGSPSTQRMLGTSQLEAGKEAQGITNLETAFAAKPPDTAAGIQLAILYARRGQSLKALSTAEAVLKTDPQNLALHNFLANIKGRLGDMAGARKIWEAALAKDPTFRHIVINLSWLDMEQRQFEPARVRLTEHLKRQSDDPDVLFQLGTLERQAGRPAEAERHWMRAYTVHRRDMRPGLSLIDLWLEQNQPDKAVPIAKALRNDFGDQRALLVALARISKAKGDLPGAKAALTEATRAAGDDADAQVAIGRMQMSVGETKGAAYNVVKALQASPNHRDALVLQVEIDAKSGDAAAVDASLKALASKHPTAPQTLVTKAHVALSRGQWQAAVSELQSAMATAPSTPMAILLSRALVVGGQTAKAVTAMEAWARKQPNDTLALMTLAELQSGAGQLADARATFKKLLAMEPENPVVLARFASVLHQARDPEALGLAERAYRKAPGSSENADLLGWIHARNGQVDTALPLLREARFRSPENGEVRFHLAYVLAKTGRLDEARSELTAALQGPVPPTTEPAEVLKLKATLGMR